MSTLDDRDALGDDLRLVHLRVERYERLYPTYRTQSQRDAITLAHALAAVHEETPIDRLLVAMDISGDYTELIKAYEELVSAHRAELAASRAYIRATKIGDGQLFQEWVKASAMSALQEAEFRVATGG